MADKGVLFLDEIGNLSSRLQGKLLRVLEEREVRRIGDFSTHKIDVQIIAATNKNLYAEMEMGHFRHDLFHRLNVMEIQVPSLRERKRDIPLLIEHYLNGINDGKSKKQFTKEAWDILIDYEYPGNVRELRNIVLSGYYSSAASIIDVDHLPKRILQDKKGERVDKEMQDLFFMIKNGKIKFENVQSDFIKGEINIKQLRQIIHLALFESGGFYQVAFSKLHISSKKYAAMLQFLKRNKCYIDFRKYRSKHY
jgi:transcriptional regulator with PAS, ATPase and Fis domain